MMRRLTLTVVFMSACFAASASDLGRLFFTPQERESLDRQRRGEKVSPDSAGAQLGGFIRRSDGKNTIWVDGKPLRATDKQVEQTAVDGDVSPAAGIRIRPSPVHGTEDKAGANNPTKPNKPAQKPAQSPR